MIRRAEADLLREREPKDHPRLAVVGQALPRGAVDQRVEVGKTAQRFAGDGDRERHGRAAARLRIGAARSVERLSAPQHGVEHLQAPRGGRRLPQRLA